MYKKGDILCNESKQAKYWIELLADVYNNCAMARIIHVEYTKVVIIKIGLETNFSMIGMVPTSDPRIMKNFLEALDKLEKDYGKV